MSEPILDIRDLSVTFAGQSSPVRAVSGLSLRLEPGKVLTILGESGSGKSVTLNAILRLLPKRGTRIEGSIRAVGKDVFSLNGRALRGFRGRDVAMIFQEPALAFDPLFTIGSQIVETLRNNLRMERGQARRRAEELLDMVRIPLARQRLDAYPHEISGGMRQRAMIALALSCNPKLLLADEPTTALDATVQIQTLLLLRELQEELGMSIVFVTHDIGVANEISDEVAVMYAGRLMETAPVVSLIRQPAHPYTNALLGSAVQGSARGKRLSVISGSPPDLANLPRGCAFAPRCPGAINKCLSEIPPMTRAGGEQNAACWRLGEIAAFDRKGL